MSRQRKLNRVKSTTEKKDMSERKDAEVNSTPNVDKSTLPKDEPMKEKSNGSETTSSRGNTKHINVADETPHVYTRAKDPVDQKVNQTPTGPTTNNLTADVKAKVIAYINSLEDISNTSAVVSAQYGFFKTLRSVLRVSSSNDFQELWNTVLNTANQHKRVFNMNRVNLAPHSWLGSEREATTYRRLTWVILETMDPKVRFKDTDKVLNDLTLTTMTAVERNNLLSFYG